MALNQNETTYWSFDFPALHIFCSKHKQKLYKKGKSNTHSVVAFWFNWENYESHSFKITCTDNDQYLPTGGQEAYAMSDTVITESVGVSLSNGD